LASESARYFDRLSTSFDECRRVEALRIFGKEQYGRPHQLPVLQQAQLLQHGRIVFFVRDGATSFQITQFTEALQLFRVKVIKRCPGLNRLIPRHTDFIQHRPRQSLP